MQQARSEREDKESSSSRCVAASLCGGCVGVETLVCGSNIIFSSTSTLVGGVGSRKVDDVSAKMRGDKQTLSTQWTS